VHADALVHEAVAALQSQVQQEHSDWRFRDLVPAVWGQCMLDGQLSGMCFQLSHAPGLTCSCSSWRSRAIRLSAEADVRPSTIMASGQTCPGGVCVEPSPSILSPAAVLTQGWNSGASHCLHMRLLLWRS
jgi:hypothetical protein